MGRHLAPAGRLLLALALVVGAGLAVGLSVLFYLLEFAEGMGRVFGVP